MHDDDPIADRPVRERVVVAGPINPGRIDPVVRRPGSHRRWVRLTTTPYFPPAAGPRHSTQRPRVPYPAVPVRAVLRGALLITVGAGVGLMLGDIAGSREPVSSQLAAAPLEASAPPTAEPPQLLPAAPPSSVTYMVRPAPVAALSRARTVPAPARVSIPVLGIDQELVELAVGEDRKLAAPATRTDIGWWSDGPAPGEDGAVVVAAHVSLEGEPAVFAGLSTLTPGDDIALVREDGSTATYQVATVEQFSKTAFPDGRVYSREGANRLRLVTCGGAVDPATRHFVDNVVVFADLREDTLAPAGA